MNRRKLLAYVYLTLVLLHDVLAVQHWKVSDNGKEIEAVEDSPFTIVYSGSLLDFLNQYENVRSFGSTAEELQRTLDGIGLRESKDEPDIEARVRSENSDCQKVDQELIGKDTFKTSYTPEFCPDFHELNADYVEMLRVDVGSERLKGATPVCSQWHPLGNFGDGDDPDSTFTAIRMKGRLPDAHFGEILELYFSNFKRYSPDKHDEYGEFLSHLLSQKDLKFSGHPYLHMAAAAYWRATGELNEAYHCYRSAAHYIGADTNPESRFMRDTLMISLAGLMNKGSQPTIAFTIMHWLHLSGASFVNTRSDCFTAAMVAQTADIVSSTGKEYVASQEIGNGHENNYDASLFEYRRALGMKSKRTKAISKKIWNRMMYDMEQKISLILCLRAITHELENQKDNLEKLVKDKLYYNEIYGAHVKIEKQVASKMIAPEIRKASRYAYEKFKYGYSVYRSCSTTLGKRFMLSSNPKDSVSHIICSVMNKDDYEHFLWPQRKQTLTNRPVLNETSWRVTELFARDKNYARKIVNLKNGKIEEQRYRTKYPYSPEVLATVKDRFWRRTDWPNSVDCQAIISQSDLFNKKLFPQTSIPFENRGFVISDYLTKFLGLQVDEEHPLPWNEPVCDKIDKIMYHPLSTFKGIVEMHEMPSVAKPKYAESRLKTRFVRLTDRILEDIEMAQRIKTLLDNNLGPKWIALNLAGMYWRVKGNPHHAARCLMHAVMEEPFQSDIALVQLAQVLYKATGRREEAIHMLHMAEGVDEELQPLIPWLKGRLHLIGLEVDEAVQNMKLALDRDPFDKKLAEDLLKIACSGKSSKPAISSQNPTVCCSPLVQNAVCFKNEAGGNEQCYVVDPETGGLIYNRCNGVYTGVSYKSSPYANIVSPFLPIYQTVEKRDLPSFEDDLGGLQVIETEELPLDYGGSEAFFMRRPAEWWTRAHNEIKYEKWILNEKSEWDETHPTDLAKIPEKPLSFLWIRDKSEMLTYDVKLPAVLPAPSLQQVRNGLNRFPPPRQRSGSCSGVNKLSVLLENQVSTWVSVTAKGEDIEKYVDLRGPVTGIAGLQPICPSPSSGDASPILGLDHIPAFALSDQFLFYKPEKMLTDALKSLGNDRDSIEHVAARLHTALLADGMGKNQKPVNWLLCVLSSLYWRVVGDAPRAVGCLRCALQTAPSNMRDVVLISLANICHQAGLLHSALIAAGSALSTSPNLVAIHFTIANIYASIGDYQRALEFYYSTLSLQANFEPAKERIRAIYCHAGDNFSFQI